MDILSKSRLLCLFLLLFAHTVLAVSDFYQKESEYIRRLQGGGNKTIKSNWQCIKAFYKFTHYLLSQS